MIEFVNGDLLKSDCEAIVHQVNCLGIMGAGLALQIKKTYPNVYEEYVKFCKDTIGDEDDEDREEPENLLGEMLIVKTKDFDVVNIFSQCYIGTNRRQTYYSALRDNLLALSRHYPYKTIGIPYKIGCGLAGGDWNIVYTIIEEAFKDSDKVLKIYKL